MVATNDFSGLTSWAWALASAAAMVPILSLQHCIAILRFEQIETDGTRFGALGADAVADRLFGILRHQGLELGFGLLVFEMRPPGAGEDRRKFRPGIGGGHIHDTNRLKPRPGRLDPK